ncbi:hypothetical protein CVU76_00025 [Candidatus Dojkabacteria bacterium HGW-Dojkabacteria-1]|uniref:CDP-alcohol phosphatidyltransferase family protein n=1 Tax=Candidatus Dojkabacteria bacterium HGW-Dojkabacteria-1 TaxID=2013761 RepID=A0A2N2F2L2_9BACT|nr:MAG: hypothetical protein CVU76_00025 [Candidatus Dojkabacteria bacterium HGW-Dojkabacteria-1]
MKLLLLDSLHKRKDLLLDRYFNPFFKYLYSHKITPNFLTGVSVLSGLLAIYFLFINQAVFICLIVLHIILDALDGTYARSLKLKSLLGDFLDHGGDLLIGSLLLFKVANFLGGAWVILPWLFLFEASVLARLSLLDKKFPSRNFIYFFLFGLFELGMLFQVILQPISFLLFLASHFVIQKFRQKPLRMAN